MRSALRRLLIPMLRRAPDEVERAARHFSVTSASGRDLVANVGRAFLGGYDAMLRARALDAVGTEGSSVDPHFRPFFFEGAAMGYLPRAYYTKGAGPSRAEADLLSIDPGFLYLYYVGLGFWFGFRHPGRPAAIEELARYLDPFYAPLCYDGFGFKLGFFDYPKRPGVRAVLDRAPAHRSAAIYQGFGRALFFVCLDDPARFAREKAGVASERRSDLEAGRSLALAFTGLRRPEAILSHLASAADDGELADRILGVTWALTARAMNDAVWFTRCLSTLSPSQQELLTRLAHECRAARDESVGYEAWRRRTQERALSVYADAQPVGPR